MTWKVSVICRASGKHRGWFVVFVVLQSSCVTDESYCESLDAATVAAQFGEKQEIDEVVETAVSQGNYWNNVLSAVTNLLLSDIVMSNI